MKVKAVDNLHYVVKTEIFAIFPEGSATVICGPAAVGIFRRKCNVVVARSAVDGKYLADFVWRAWGKD